MNAARRAAVLLAERIETATAAFGRRVSLDPQAVLDRSGDIVLGEPGATSPNGHCRILAAADGWVALNLARPSDLELMPAWIGAEIDDDPWQGARNHAAVTTAAWRSGSTWNKRSAKAWAGVSTVRTACKDRRRRSGGCGPCHLIATKMK